MIITTFINPTWENNLAQAYFPRNVTLQRKNWIKISKRKY